MVAVSWYLVLFLLLDAAALVVVVDDRIDEDR